MDDGYDAKNIGRRVGAYRRAGGMTAEQLAERVGGGMTRTAIAKLENGHRVDVSTELLVQLAWALEVTPMALLFPLENPTATINVGSTSGSTETLGYWLEGIAVPGVEPGPGQKLANAVRAESRRLALAHLGYLGRLGDVIDSQESLTAAERARLHAEADRHGDEIEAARGVLELLRAKLGLDGDG